MSNRAASSPPVIEYVSPAPSASLSSLDCTSITEVWFSATEAVADDVIAGASLTSVTVTVTFRESDRPSESVTRTMIS